MLNKPIKFGSTSSESWYPKHTLIGNISSIFYDNLKVPPNFYNRGRKHTPWFHPRKSKKVYFLKSPSAEVKKWYTFWNSQWKSWKNLLAIFKSILLKHEFFLIIPFHWQKNRILLIIFSSSILQAFENTIYFQILQI